MSAPVVQTLDLAKTYGRLAALDGCTLSIPRGEIFGLLGPNGSGKTTLIRLLMGFLKPSRGTATIGGRDCFQDSVAVHADVSYVPGDVRLVRGMRAKDVLTLFARLRGQAQPTRGLEVAERLGLDLSRRTGQMSTGMRQKLAIATAFAADVPLFILDEPTSNLDPTVRGIVLALIREARDSGGTVVFSSHVLTEIEQTCDRVAILRAGRLVHDQPMSEVRRGHRIGATTMSPLPAPPAQFERQVTITRDAPDRVTIDATGDLAPLLGWLATLPLANIQIQPIGLQRIYDSYHAAGISSAEVAA
jgi:ABC-2 type transport system ATP-binding protein